MHLFLLAGLPIQILTFDVECVLAEGSSLFLRLSSTTTEVHCIDALRCRPAAAYDDMQCCLFLSFGHKSSWTRLCVGGMVGWLLGVNTNLKKQEIRRLSGPWLVTGQLYSHSQCIVHL